MIDRVPVAKLKDLLGAHTKAGLTKILQGFGLPALPDALGWPIVLEEDLRAVLGRKVEDTPGKARRKRPNLDEARM